MKAAQRESKYFIVYNENKEGIYSLIQARIIGGGGVMGVWHPMERHHPTHHSPTPRHPPWWLQVIRLPTDLLYEGGLAVASPHPPASRSEREFKQISWLAAGKPQQWAHKLCDPRLDPWFLSHQPADLRRGLKFPSRISWLVGVGSQREGRGS